MKRIYIIDEFTSSQKNGIGTFLRELVACLRRTGADICLITFNANVKEFTLTEKRGIRYLLFPVFASGHFLAHADIIRFFFSLYITDSASNVFMFNHSPCNELLSMVKETFPLSKVVFTIHDMGWTSYLAGDIGRLRQILSARRRKPIRTKYADLLAHCDKERQMLETADRVICLSPDTRSLLEETYRIAPERIALLPNGLHDRRKPLPDDGKSAIRQSFAVEAEEKILLFVGRPIASKGIDALAEAWEQLADDREHRYRLVIAGTDNLVRLEQVVSRFSPAIGRVTFTGQLAAEALRQWYAIADIGIIASRYEQCSYTGIEMMMHGLPVISTDGYGLRNMFRHEENAWVVPIGRRDHPSELGTGLAVAIRTLLGSDELRARLAESARRCYETTYHARQMAKNYKHFLRTL